MNNAVAFTQGEVQPHMSLWQYILDSIYGTRKKKHENSYTGRPCQTVR